jgi:inhibitor of growth protein 4
MEIDPNEPVFCTCNQVAFGEMIACDNPDCEIEWFHVQCIGGKPPSDAKWLCPDCRR